MLKIFLILFSFAIFYGCSTQKETTLSDDSNNNLSAPRNPTSQDKKRALDHFINGTIAESKGDFATAILEYQDALRIDPNAGIFYALAKNYFTLKKIPIALQNAKRAIEWDSTEINYYELLADIFSGARQFDSAAVVLEKMLLIDSANISAAFKLARIYENNKPLKAIGIYQDISNRIGPEWSVLIRIAELYEKLGEFDKSAEAIEELLSIDPSNTSLQKLLADFYMRSESFSRADSIYTDILELTPDDLDARERKAQLYLQQDKWEEASEQYSYILDQDEVPLDVKIRIGASYFQRSLKDSVLLPITKEFFIKINNDTTDWQVKMYLGAIALNEKDNDEAIKNFETVTRLANWNVDAWIQLGGLYFDNQKYPEAEAVMNEAIESFPQDFAVNLILGLALAQQDKHTQAREYLKTSVDLNPNDINALSAYAYTLNQLKESEKAIEFLNKALNIKPDDVNLLGTLGLIYDSQEKWIECDSVYQKALQIDSENALVNNNYAYSLAERGVNLDEALEMAQLAIEKDPENSSYLDTIGWVYFKLGDYIKAKKYIEKSIEFAGEKAVQLEHLGDIVYMMGNKIEAQELWQQAFDLDATNDKLKLKIETGEI
jgi:tetratricopeptide (TPR) repeat protein